ncbi:MAG: outer membrane beta-barrel protein [Prevotella sp.]|nr:outer membrane beta-barrel protein [Prevotella sp.]
MIKKTILSLLFAAGTVAVSAQTAPQYSTPFGEGKYYVATSLSGLDLNYSSSEDWKMDFSLKGGYLFTDNWMITAQVEYDWRKKASNAFKAGAGLRYYIDQNGLYAGLGANYVHRMHNIDDFMPTAQVGYSFFLNRTVTIEPEVYYNLSLKDNDYSGFGLRIGFGVYFE